MARNIKMTVSFAKIARWIGRTLPGGSPAGFQNESKVSSALHYTVAFVAVLTVVAIRELLNPLLGDHHRYILFFSAIAITSWYSGFGPTLLAISLSFFAANSLFRATGYRFSLSHLTLEDFIGLGGFLCSGLVVAFASKALHAARRRAESKQLELGREICERKRVQEKLEQVQAELREHAATLERKVEERTATLTETVQSLEGVCYHVAHDLRAPLRAMGGFMSLLLESNAPRFDAAGRAHADRIIHAAAHMDDLIQDLLAYGRLGHASLPLQRLELERSVDLALELLKDEIAAKHAEVVVHRPLHYAQANGPLLGQIMAHLLCNSLKFATSGVTPRIQIWSETNGPKIRLSIQDNGIGIAPEYHERIFRVFERLAPSEDVPGNGIGLAMVRKGMQRMKGRSGVESKPGNGSRFWVELTLATQKPPLALLGEKSDPGGRRQGGGDGESR
ncbi:MAG: Integral rane sensor signal transduction histidine kinase [Pedosphaera sp.]|nr:Integral rane sensor signal transduction histidine kinase [Pedosphaera sp.]